MTDLDAIRALAEDQSYRGPAQHLRSWSELDALCDAVVVLLDIAQAAKAMREATANYVIETEKDVPEFSVNATNAATIREHEATAALDAALARLEE